MGKRHDSKRFSFLDLFFHQEQPHCLGSDRFDYSGIVHVRENILQNVEIIDQKSFYRKKWISFKIWICVHENLVTHSSRLIQEALKM